MPNLQSSSFLLWGLIFLCGPFTFGQNVSGLLEYDAQKSFDGYNLFYPHSQTNVYLLDNCGRVVNSWTDSLYRPGNSAYLRDDGSLMKTGSRGPAANTFIQAGGAGEVVQIKDWDNQLLWQYVYSDSTHRMHHDIEPLPNGNVLLIAWEYRSAAEAFAAGRDTSMLLNNQLWPEQVIEIQPIGTDSGEIVWAWYAWDHLIQDFDSNQDNYGDPAAHPELIDINYDPTNGFQDWLHFNSIDYNETLDHILISVPRFDEVWVIDHSTTTEEAASHQGGTSGKGGDLLYRWGNPASYGAGSAADQRLYFQHNAHWIAPQAVAGDPDFGKIILFNNRNPGLFSSADIIQTPVANDGSYSLTNGSYLPDSALWKFGDSTANHFYSGGLSGVQRLPNGNTLICSGREGLMFEITPQEETVWKYINPLWNGVPAAATDTIPDGSNLVFRLERYGPNHPAIAGRILTPGNSIELNPDTALCNSQAVSIDPSIRSSFRLYPNPGKDRVLVELLGEPIRRIEVYDLMGKLQFARNALNQQVIEIETGDWRRGVFVVRINGSLSRRMLLQ